jgi:O-antigen/teichoic acid export membrane protein
VFCKLHDKYNALPVQIKASFWFLICSIGQRGINMLTTPIFTRLLSTDEYGQFSVFNSWLGIISVIITLNMFAGVYTRGLVVFGNDRNRFSSSMQGLNLLLCVFWTLIYFLFHNLWNDLFKLTTLQMVSMMLIIWLSATFYYWASSQRVVYQYRPIVITSIVFSIINPMLGILFVLHAEDKVTARILAVLLSQIIVYAWMFVYMIKQGKKIYVGQYWKHALGFNIPLIPHYLSQVVLNSSDRIMIKELDGSHHAGIYSLSYSLSQVMLMFNAALMDTLSPWIYTKIKENRIKDISSVAYGSLIIIAGVNLLLIAFAPELVRVFAPIEYYDAIYCIPPIVMSVYFIYCYDLFAKFGFYFEKTKLITAATVVVGITNIITNIVFINMFGYIAAAYTTLVCYALYALFHYVTMLKVCNTKLNGARPYSHMILLIITFLFVVIGFLYLITYKNIISRYGLTALLLLIVFINREKIKQIVRQIVEMRQSNKVKS